MNQQETITNINNWLSRHRNRIVTLIILIAIASLSWKGFTTYAILTINLETPAGDSERAYIYISTDATTREIGTASGTFLVPRATKSVLVTTGPHTKTQVTTSIPWYGYLSSSVTLQPDRDANRVAYQSTLSEPCATYDHRSDSLMSYSCNKPEALLKYQYAENGLTFSTIAGFYYPGRTAKPYMGGLIGASVHTHTDSGPTDPVAAVSAEGDYTFYQSPRDSDHATHATYEVFTNTSNLEDSRFILVGSDGSIHLGSPIEGSTRVNYVSHPAPENYDSTIHQTLCAFTDTDAYCYRGRAQIGDRTNDSAPSSGSISTLSFSSNQIEVHNLVTTTALDAFVLTKNGALYAKEYKKLYQITREHDTYTLHERAQNIDALAATTEVYYLQKNSIFKIIDDSTAVQVFFSPRMEVKSLMAFDKNVFILTSPLDSKTKITNAYLLTDSVNSSPGRRLIDILPLPPGELPGVVSHTIVGNRLYISLAVATAKKTPLGTNSVDQQELAQKKLDVLDALAANGIDVDSIEITFTY